MLPCILGLSGPKLTADERAFFREAEPAGFLLFRRNCEAPAQLRALTDDLRELTGRADLLILVDQEGGSCSRLGPPHWPTFPAQWRFAELYERAPISALEAARVNALAIALVLAEAGINVACTPVLDLRHADAHPVIGERALGSDPDQVASLGRMVLDGLAEGGVTGIMKHMPGHGRARVDSHVQLPIVCAGAEELEADFAPFRKLAARARIGMTAHIVYSAFDADRPATLSPTVIDNVIRGRIGFDGLLLSDDVVMEALAGSLGERSQRAIAAGCDLVLHGSGVIAEGVEVAGALGPIGEGALERLGVVTAAGTGEHPKLADLLAKRDALLAHAAPAVDAVTNHLGYIP
jgi:beta-N-acetylhexosaminidase